METVELLVLIFDQPNRARQVYDELRAVKEHREIGWTHIAILKKSDSGETSWKDVDDLDPRLGAAFGAFIGGLIGLLGGPAGAFIGAAAGAATGGAAAERLDFGFSEEFLKEVDSALSPGSSALMILADEEKIPQILSHLQAYDGRLLRHVVRKDIVDRLHKDTDSRD